MSGGIDWDDAAVLRITCAKGLVDALAGECAKRGHTVLDRGPASVELNGSLNDCMALNLWLRSAQRVLYRVAGGRCRDANELYALVNEVAWEAILPSDGYVSVTGSVRNDTIRDDRFAMLKAKDAVVDRVRDHTGERPYSGPRRDQCVVFVYWNENEAAVYLDTSGESLSHRGYRQIPLEAPMRESLAAACVLSSGYDGSRPLMNPMCGSGTLAIEAALIGLNRAPALLRENFGFMHLLGFQPDTWQRLLDEAMAGEREAPAAPIQASDIDAATVRAARKNAALAGVEEHIDFAVGDFRDFDPPEQAGILLFNPPYGERIGRDSELADLYKEIGDYLKQRCAGHTAWIFTGNIGLLKRVGLAHGEKRVMYNGPLECRLADYAMY